MRNWLCALTISTIPGVTMAQQGGWEDFFYLGPTPEAAIVAVHLVHVFDGTQGRVIGITYESQALDNCGGGANGGTDASDRVLLWTPPPIGSPPGYPGTFEAAPLCRTFLFCGGHTQLADGRALLVGGQISIISGFAQGSPNANLFYPTAPPGNRWNTILTPLDMTHGRWYPTATTLPDGRVLVCSGLDENGLGVPIPELYDPQLNAWSQPLGNVEWYQQLYPYMLVLPDGNLVDAGPHVNARILISSPEWELAGTLPTPQWPPNPPPPPGNGGSCAMYEPGKIVRCGGGQDAVATTWVVNLDFTDPNNPNPGDPYDPPAWLLAAHMNKARHDHNLVIMPDGKLLAVGGKDPSLTPQWVLEPEIFDPTSGTWTIQPPCDPNNPRMYHSTAMLLPDGRVVSAGGDGLATAQIFKPPYLMGNPPPARPIIVSAPTYMQYGQEYTILYSPNGGPLVSRACLIRLAAVTHGFDQNQRRVPLNVARAPSPCAEPCIMVTAPANGNIAPPGYYMLFILNQYAANQFAPSVATYVQVGP